MSIDLDSDVMLELHDPTDAPERIEAYLRAAGFFVDGGRAADGLCADVYLGYALSQPLRRSAAPRPVEPVALPVAACRIRALDERTPMPGAYGIERWRATWSVDGYASAIEAVRSSIAAGDVYQVNLVQHLRAAFQGDPRGVADTLAAVEPLAPRPLVGDGWAIVSASPEGFLSRRGEVIATMPIKGTRPAGETLALEASAKDAAEHVMIVDLERNDLGRVCRPGSVRVASFMSAREMAGVVHLVSRVEGTVRRDVGWAELVRATFPGGSVTGAPKIAALDRIAALEPVGRGASMGALGTVRPDGDFDLALTIRTFAIADDRIHLWVGGGITWDSRAVDEVEESWVKARPLLEAIGGVMLEPVAA